MRIGIKGGNESGSNVTGIKENFQHKKKRVRISLGAGWNIITEKKTQCLSGFIVPTSKITQV